MIAPSSTAIEEPQEVLSGEFPVYSAAEVDASCRMPVLVLLMGALAWLVLGALAGVIAAIKTHAPGFLAAVAPLTYGRIFPASLNALVYGFVAQAGLGMTLWMFCRLGRNLLLGPRIITVSAVVWNLGLVIGLSSILDGESTGYPWLEMSRGADYILFCAYSLIGAWALINLHYRRVRPLYVSQWFLFTALLWFPWVFSTAILLLLRWPVRGILQAVVDGWYRHNLFELCFGSFGLAAIFYFLPKLRRRPLASEQLALCGFWLLVLIGGWGGLRMGEPVPSWISSVSDIGRVLLLLAGLVIGLCWYQTNKSASSAAEPVLRFIWVAGIAYLLGLLFNAAVVLPAVNCATLFTLFDQGLVQLKIHGFLAMALAGAIYYIVPRLTATAWPSPGLIQLHFWCAVLGTVLMVATLLIGGVLEGVQLQQPKTDFIQIVRHLLPFLGTSTLGATVLFAGYAIFFVHLSWLLKASCPCAFTLTGRKSSPTRTSANKGVL